METALEFYDRTVIDGRAYLGPTPSRGFLLGLFIGERRGKLPTTVQRWLIRVREQLLLIEDREDHPVLRFVSDEETVTESVLR